MEEKRSFWWLKLIIFILILIIGVVAYAFYVGPTGIFVKEINVIDNRLPSTFYGYKIVQLSDIHYKSTTEKSDLKKISQKVNQSKPNIIIISGDLLDKKTVYNDQDSQDLANFLNDIKAQYKYIISGDHDQNELFTQIINKSDFKLLDNTYEIIYHEGYDPILIAGLSSRSDKTDTKEKLVSIKEAISSNAINYNILVLHEPSLIEDFDYQNYQLILAGHTHNGQINIPGIKQLFISKKDAEYYETYYDLENTKMYISSGIGTTNVKARLFNRPSINLYRLLNK